jgi:hypothetical protein
MCYAVWYWVAENKNLIYHTLIQFFFINNAQTTKELIKLTNNQGLESQIRSVSTMQTKVEE